MSSTSLPCRVRSVAGSARDSRVWRSAVVSALCQPQDDPLALHPPPLILTCLSSLGKNVESFLLYSVGEQFPTLYLEPSHSSVKHRPCESLEVRLWTVDRQDDVRVLV